MVFLCHKQNIKQLPKKQNKKLTQEKELALTSVISASSSSSCSFVGFLPVAAVNRYRARVVASAEMRWDRSVEALYSSVKLSFR